MKEWNSAKPDSHTHWLFMLLRIALGLFFSVIAIAKLRSIPALIDEMGRFKIVPEFLLEYHALEILVYFGLGLELVLGICLLTKWCYQAAVRLLPLLCLLFVILFVQGWIRGLSLSCHCLGVARSVENYPLEVGWRTALLLSSLLLLWDSYRQSKQVFHSRRMKVIDL